MTREVWKERALWLLSLGCLNSEGFFIAKVAKLVDALDLGSSGATHESSSLSFRTRLALKHSPRFAGDFLCIYKEKIYDNEALYFALFVLALWRLVCS